MTFLAHEVLFVAGGCRRVAGWRSWHTGRSMSGAWDGRGGDANVLDAGDWFSYEDIGTAMESIRARRVGVGLDGEGIRYEWKALQPW